MSCGSWESPITTDAILASSISISSLHSSPSGSLIWIESRPEEAGRNALVERTADGVLSEIIPVEIQLDGKPFNARSRVHEYGGGSFAVSGDSLYFAEFSTGAIFKTMKRNEKWTTPVQVSPVSTVYRYADFSVSPSHPHLLISILEDHTHPSPATVENSVILLDSLKKSFITLAAGNDFYSNPRWNSSGDAFLFITWNHPNMPWNDSTLFTMSYNAGKVEPVRIAGGNSESISQPRWNGASIIYLSDRSGYYELYSYSNGKETQVMEQLTGSDIGAPDWTFGQSTHRRLSENTWIAKSTAGRLAIIDLAARTSELLSTTFDSIQEITVLEEEENQKTPKKLALLVSSSSTSSRLIIFDLANSRFETIRKSSNLDASIDPGYISKPEEIIYPVRDGTEAYGYYYAPTNKDYKVSNEKIPLIVQCHGGPTSSTSSSLNWIIQYFTSRGFAYCSVNYGGSSGYGAEFRKRLDGNWGIVDVEDTVSAVEYLVKSERGIDRDRVAIVGGSAGGFTVLAALTKSTIFTAGVSQYGISDLKLLGDDTHKFESKYLDGLLGLTGKSEEEIAKIYHDRSPIHSSASINCSLLLLQGSEDRVVPIEQARLMKERVDQAGNGKAELVIFEGEGHGWRKAENKKKALEAELEFYRKTWKISSI